VESVVLGLMLITAVIVLPFWTWLAQQLSKRKVYVIGMLVGIVVLLLLVLVQPHQYVLTMALAVLIGTSVSVAHVLPDAIFPDVIDWDELRTGTRHEGIYYGVKDFIRKLTSALAIFIALQVLGWLGYQSPPPDATVFAQPQSALWGMRLLAGPVAALLLIGAVAVTWFYLLNRERYARVQRLLARRQRRQPPQPVEVRQ
jgi:glycoside/pentoside/hexuronide:cation symporter, GPH family